MGLKKKKFDIFKTFDIFDSEAISIIKERIIKFVLIEAENFFITKSNINAEFDKDEALQITVFNNPKVYNLLTNTWNRYKQKVQNESIKC